MGSTNMMPNMAVVISAIEKALLEMGDEVLEEINDVLTKNTIIVYWTAMNIRNIQTVLKEIYGEAYTTITKHIRNKPSDSISRKPIKEFIKKIEA